MWRFGTRSRSQTGTLELSSLRLGEAISNCGRDGHTTLTLLLLAVHVEREGERTLAETLGLLLQLLQLTLRQTAELEPRFLDTKPCRESTSGPIRIALRIPIRGASCIGMLTLTTNLALINDTATADQDSEIYQPEHRRRPVVVDLPLSTWPQIT